MFRDFTEITETEVSYLAGFRHEIKLLLTYADYKAFKPVLAGLLPLDPNTGERGEYFIRSLYLDDVNDTSYLEKMAGVADRKKYRIRIYNCEDKVIKLECKEKRGDRIRKRSVSVTRECADAMCAGDFSLLRDIDNPLAQEVFGLSRKMGLKPCVVVDYDREAYLHPVSNVRLTFDKALHGGVESADIFDPSLVTLPVFKDNSVIFEVKYDDVLPKFLQQVVSSTHGSKLALSKFTLCRDELKKLKMSY